MVDTVTVASRVHTAIQIVEPLPEKYREQPGLAPALRSVVINGANHETAIGDIGLTHNVDAEVFGSWLDEQKRTNTPLAGMIYIVEDDEDVAPIVENGTDPALAKANEGENADLAAEGSTITHEPPLTADEMAAHSQPDAEPTHEG